MTIYLHGVLQINALFFFSLYLFIYFGDHISNPFAHFSSNIQVNQLSLILKIKMLIINSY